MTERTENWQGMNWIRPAKRLAIYLRDGLACVYCGAAMEDGTQLTLDHLTPHSHGGQNEESNLVTCCAKCNSSRGNRSWKTFADKVAAYIDHNVSGQQIRDFIRKTVNKPLDVETAKKMIAARSNFSGACQAVREKKDVTRKHATRKLVEKVDTSKQSSAVKIDDDIAEWFHVAK